jgi:transposase
MEDYRRSEEEGKAVFVGVDLHRFKWHVTVRTEDQELFSGTVPGQWQALQRLLDRYRGYWIQVVYEAGYYGFWLYDRLVAYGAGCIVTPPSLLPQEYGNRVKTDRRDSRKLAYLLAKGMLKRVWVPSLEERYHRQVVRTRRQLIWDRVRVQNRIKAELRFYGIELVEPYGKWPRVYVENLWRICFGDSWMQQSFHRLLEQLEFLTEQISKQTELVRQLSHIDYYRDRVTILLTVPGIGVISAMELLVELQDVARFRRSDQLAAYMGLTPSQYSSADKVRMGRITRVGKNALRGVLVEVAWYLIRKDMEMGKKYERIKARSGSKRAIVAIARRVLLRTRRMLLDGSPYVEQKAA